MQDHNVLIMDEPTNHMDMEAIEALNLALEYYEGTLIFVSHDREFVSSLADRIVEIKDKKLNDYQGNYEEFLAYQLA
jgi:ATPase subunit of ABC transporter with duplicated ATPase domains